MISHPVLERVSVDINSIEIEQRGLKQRYVTTLAGRPDIISFWELRKKIETKVFCSRCMYLLNEE